MKVLVRVTHLWLSGKTLPPFTERQWIHLEHDHYLPTLFTASEVTST
jgi:hypothetical protein